ncbi:MFS transporter [Plantactinospora sp. GCM10030261]|uniref:MFS transporter n=1 Tax=Plantactinospora sp. GCM10030261 TaxID=3273420 RepID=UPI003618A672
MGTPPKHPGTSETHFIASRSGPPSASGTLLVVLAGFLALPMSMSGAAVAIPDIAADLNTGGAAAQWVVTSYFLTASALMLVAGSLADALGRRRIYRLGAGAYAAGSLTAAVAPMIGGLLAARVLTGIGAAAVMASGGAILAATFTGRARTRAFAAMGATAGLGLALGPAASGWMVGALGWRLGFGVFALVGLALLVGTGTMSETRDTDQSRIAWAGATVLATSLTLLRHRRFTGWLLAASTMAFGYGGVLAFLPSYLQSPAGYSAATTGLIMLPPTVPMVLLPTLAARLVNRGDSPAIVITSALVVQAAGNAWLSRLHADIDIASLAGPLLTIGAGAGLAAGIIDAQAMNQVNAGRAGMAAGMLNTVRSTANALVLALFGAAVTALLSTRLGSSEVAGRVATGNIPTTDAEFLGEHLTDAWRLTLLGLALLCATAALVTGRLVRNGADAPGAARARRSTDGP